MISPRLSAPSAGEQRSRNSILFQYFSREEDSQLPIGVSLGEDYCGGNDEE